MTAVEWFAKQLLEYKSPTNINGTDYILIPTNKIEFLQEQAKEMVKEEKQLEYTRGFDDGYQRKNQELDYLRGKNHSCQNNFKNSFKHELNKSE